MLRLPRLVCVLLTLFAPMLHAADLADAVNALRARGCSQGEGTKQALERSAALDSVAREWSKGGRLKQAMQRTQYRATNSSSMRISGAKNDRMILDMLRDHYCKVVTDPEFTALGIYRRGEELWMVVAAPFDLPRTKDAGRVANDVLQLVNEARSRARKCGRVSFAAAPALKLSSLLNQAAQIHARDMASHDHFEHEGTDGSTPADRISRVGYRWKNVAENIAAGAPTAATVVEGWLKSPGHCANIMGPQYREMGLAFALEPTSEAGIYWAQEFGTQQ